MNYQMLIEDAALAAYCSKAAQAPYLALDTEFIRTNTLLPKLGLIQLNDGSSVVLVDPLCIKDWQPLIALLANPAVLKLVHSCTEDLEALASVGIEQITPLLDTQLAAEIIGWGGSMGYARLVEQMLGVVVDKTESRTDWLARPLAETQLQYAANDVVYLLQLTPALLAALPSARARDILLAEGQSLIERRQRQMPAALKYLELKNSWQFGPRELAILRTFCAWRSQYAEEKDLALSLVIKDAVLYELARRKPQSMEALSQIEGMQGRELRRHGQLWLQFIREAKALAPVELPQTFYHLDSFPGYKQVQQQLSDAIKAAATAAAIPAEILSVKRQLNEYLNWCWRVTEEERQLLSLPEFLGGWRREILLPYLPVPPQVQALI
ncbi:ribonuclease D [Rheinheimera texasensis]|uniref:ribonuclease D n=1 Tax=Rheinheimera texasensis TaxID=306205 RepID=UPI0032B1A8CF